MSKAQPAAAPVEAKATPEPEAKTELQLADERAERLRETGQALSEALQKETAEHAKTRDAFAEALKARDILQSERDNTRKELERLTSRVEAVTRERDELENELSDLTTGEVSPNIAQTREHGGTSDTSSPAFEDLPDDHPLKR